MIIAVPADLGRLLGHIQSEPVAPYPPWAAPSPPQPRASRYDTPVDHWGEQHAAVWPSAFLEAEPQFSFTPPPPVATATPPSPPGPRDTEEKFQYESKAENAAHSAYLSGGPKVTHHKNVYCRCAPLACNCTKACTCYQNPDGTRAGYDPNLGMAKDWGAAGRFGSPEVVEDESGDMARAAGGRGRGARSSSAAADFFQPGSFMETARQEATARQRRGRGGNAGRAVVDAGTCPRHGGGGSGRGGEIRGARLRGTTSSGGSGEAAGREEWCVEGSRSHRRLERNIAAAADERRFGVGVGVGPVGTSLLELGHNATIGSESGRAPGEGFRPPRELLAFGADPDFRRHGVHRYVCDADNCEEMQCKCKRYCPLRRVEEETARSRARVRGWPDADTWREERAASGISVTPPPARCSPSYFRGYLPPRSVPWCTHRHV